MSEQPAPIRAAVVGAGTIARQHLACLATLPGVTVAAVCDLSPATAEAASERFGVPAAFTDRAEMLERVRPDVVHVATPPGAHFEVAADALGAGAAVIVEKPLAASPDEAYDLIARSQAAGCLLIEDYNYLFSRQLLDIVGRRERGELGEVRHVAIDLSLDVGGDDAAAPDGALGPHERDLLPHLASIAHAFAGPHRSVHAVRRERELVALVDGVRGTATLRFSAHSRPDGFWVRVHGTRMRATANLFEPRLTLERPRGGPRPLDPFLNQLGEARSAASAAARGVIRKLDGGPGVYEGLWELLRRTYTAIRTGEPPPIGLGQIEEVNRLAAAVADAAARP